MILLQRESRSVPAFKQKPLGRKTEWFFFEPYCNSPPFFASHEVALTLKVPAATVAAYQGLWRHHHEKIVCTGGSCSGRTRAWAGDGGRDSRRQLWSAEGGPD